MHKYILLYCCILFIKSNVNAQSASLDSCDYFTTIGYKSFDAKKYDSTIYYLQKAFVCYKIHNFPEDEAAVLNVINECLIFKNEVYKFLNYKDEIEKIRNYKYETIAEAILQLGHAYEKTGNYILAESYYLQSLNLYNQLGTIENTSYKSDIYNNLGNLHKLKANYYKALQYYSHSIQYSKNELSLIPKFQNISTVYLLVGDKKRSELYAKKATAMAERLNAEIYKSSCYANLAFCYFKNNKVDSIIYLYNKQNKKLINNSIFLNYLSRAYLLKKQYHKSLLAVKQSNVICKKNKDNNTENKNELVLAEILIETGNKNKGFYILNKLIEKSINKKNTNIDYFNALEALHILSKHKNHTDKIYEILLKFYTLQNDFYYQNIDNSASLFWREKQKNVFDNCIKWKIYTNKFEAYMLNQMNKSALFFQNLTLNKNILQQKPEIQALIRKIKYKSQSNNIDTSIYYTKKWDTFVNQINIPSSTATVAQLQNYCKHNQSLILDYFQTEDSTYACVITKDNFNIIALDSTATINRTIQQFNADIQAQKASALSYRLYNILFKNISISNYKNLIIIPDGALYNLPFDALNTDVSLNRKAQLLYQIPIIYNFSSSLLLNKTDVATYNITAFAPIFKNKPALYLAGSENEVISLKNLYRGTFFTDEDANYNNFIAQCRLNNILHLSTHAKADSNMQNYIQLYDKKLYLNDIQQSQIQSPLIFLSACETAQGMHHSTEGNISIAREIMSLGTPNTINTNWAINDIATQKIVQYFYENIEHKMPIAKALQQAKIKFIQNEFTLEAPVFWAAFNYYGDNDIVIPKRKSSLLFWSVLFFSITLLIAISYRFITRKKPLPL